MKIPSSQFCPISGDLGDLGLLNAKLDTNVSTKKGILSFHPHYDYSLLIISSLLPRKMTQNIWILAAQFLVSLLQPAVLLYFFFFYLSIKARRTLSKKIHFLFNLPQTLSIFNSLWILAFIFVPLIISNNNQSNLATGKQTNSTCLTLLFWLPLSLKLSYKKFADLSRKAFQKRYRFFFLYLNMRLLGPLCILCIITSMQRSRRLLGNVRRFWLNLRLIVIFYDFPPLHLNLNYT